VDEVKRVSAAGVDLWCDDRGSGLPLLMVHGFPLDHTMWAGQSALAPAPPALLVGERFRSAGPPPAKGSPPRSALRVIAPDLRGFGRSPARGETVAMHEFADDLAALLDALGVAEPVVYCGLSMGGYIGWQFWRKHPTRLRGLILCDTRAQADAPEAAAARRAMADRVLREGPAPLVEMMLPKLLGETTRRRRPVLEEQLRRTMMSNSPAGIAAAARGMAERPDMTAALGEIRCPTLLLVGAEDVISPPAEMRGIAAAIPGAKLVEIPAVGHMSPLESSAAVNAAIAEFLSALSPLPSGEG
jgi:pimeloyl-ACP methyl ester carboxylesterase